MNDRVARRLDAPVTMRTLSWPWLPRSCWQAPLGLRGASLVLTGQQGPPGPQRRTRCCRRTRGTRPAWPRGWSSWPPRTDWATSTSRQNGPDGPGGQRGRGRRTDRHREQPRRGRLRDPGLARSGSHRRRVDLADLFLAAAQRCAVKRRHHVPVRRSKGGGNLIGMSRSRGSVVARPIYRMTGRSATQDTVGQPTPAGVE
jgi:hypothetical protein